MQPSPKILSSCSLGDDKELTSGEYKLLISSLHIYRFAYHTFIIEFNFFVANQYLLKFLNNKCTRITQAYT